MKREKQQTINYLDNINNNIVRKLEILLLTVEKN